MRQAYFGDLFRVQFYGIILSSILRNYFEFNFAKGLGIVSRSISSDLDFKKYLDFIFLEGFEKRFEAI